MRNRILLPLLLSLCTYALPATATTPTKPDPTKAAAQTAKKATPAKIKPIVLPEATIGREYAVIFPMDLKIHYGRAIFTLGPRPDWLQFDPYTSTLYGPVIEKQPVVYSVTLKAEDMDNPSGPSKTYVLTLSVVDRPQMAVVPGAAAPKLATPIPATGKAWTYVTGPGHVVLVESPPAVPAVTGDPQNPPTPQKTTPPAKQVVIKTTPDTPIKPTKGSSTATLDETEAQLPAVMPPADIPVPTIFLDGQPTAGAKITGHVTGLASPATASVPADAAKGTPAKPGNLPLIGLLITDPIKGSYRAPLTITATQTALSAEVSATDGTFTLQPATALAFGQTLSVVADAPPGHTFTDKSPTVTAAPQSYSIKPAENGKAIAAKTDQSPVNPLLAAPSDMQVYSGIPLVKPVLTTQLANNTIDLNGTATLSQQSSGDISIAVRILQPDEKGPGELRNQQDAEDNAPCLNSDSLENGKETLEVLTISGTTTGKTVQTLANGTFTAKLVQPLLEGDRIQLVQVLPAGVKVSKAQQGNCRSAIYRVNAFGDWGRVHADFTAGILMSNNNQTAGTDSGNFSQAHQFIALTVEKNWALPGCYLRTFGQKVWDKDPAEHPDRQDKCYNWKTDSTTAAKRTQHLIPGFTSYFESRLTAIPVTSLSSKQSGSGSGGTGTTTPAASMRFASLFAPEDTAPTTPTASASDSSPASILSTNQIGSAQTARIGVGAYWPFLITRWDYHRQPNALFVAPLGKIGFDTVTGASSITVTPGTPGASITSGTSTITAESLYNYRGFGARIGHFELTRTEKRAPETNSYLDIIYGPYSNLESLVCHRAIGTSSTTLNSDGKTKTTTYTSIAGQTPATNYSGSSCTNDYPAYYNASAPGATATNKYIYIPIDSRKRLNRLDIEGLLKIPNTWLYVGFNANVGQKSAGSSHLDHGYAAPDDLRFLFGTKFDISTLLTKVGIKPF